MADHAARGFHVSLRGGQQPGTLRVSSESAAWNGDGGSVAMPLEGLHLALGGATDHMVFITHPAHDGWAVTTTDLSVLAEPALAAHPALPKLMRQSTRRRLSPSAVAAILLLLPVVFVASLFLLRGAIVRSIAARIPVDVEISLGQAAAAGLTDSGGAIDDPAATAGLATLTEPLLRGVGATRYPYTFHIVADETVNAFALPGGQVFVHSGLILRAERPEEVAGVLAHEIAHVEQRHAVRSLVQELGLSALASLVLGDASGIQGMIAASAPRLIGLKFSRDFEREADAAGFDYLVRAGIDPSGMRDMFRKLADEKGASGLDGALSLLSTHPASEERFETLDRMTTALASSPPRAAMPLDFPAFQATIRELSAGGDP